jgi:anaerobic selenocysteine-containing dehydrogenase
MITPAAGTTTVRTYCTLCGVGCPSVIVTDGDRVRSLEADREHPEGGAVCGKGRAAPEIHDHPHRVNFPAVRTAPKDASDPGWRRVTWDDALDRIAERLLAIARESGPEALAFGRGTGSGTGLRPMEPWFLRLVNLFGSPNYMTNTHLCNWARDGASYYTFGVYNVPDPDVERSGCIVLWGSNPPATLLSLGTRVAKAKARGARLIVIDPRRVGLANRADLVLQLRPGTDGALALALVRELIETRTYDDEFVREWTNAPLLVREDNGRLLRASDVASLANAGPDELVAVTDAGVLVTYRPGTGYAARTADLALQATPAVELATGARVRCATVLALLARGAPTVDDAAATTGLDARDIRAAARLMVENRPTGFHTWNGIMQHTNATQAGRAIMTFFALLGDWDRAGGNALSPARRTRDILEGAALPAAAAARRLGAQDRPLGPQVAPPGNIVAYDLYDAVLDARPYPVRGVLSFGGNTIMNTGDPLRGRAAFAGLEFFAQMEIFHTPTSAFADVLLPATTFLENDVLAITPDGMAQRRIPAARPLYERRADIAVIFDLAARLGLGAQFWDGDMRRGFDWVLGPAGLTFEGLRAHPHGVRITDDRKYESYRAKGFATPTGKVELWSERFANAAAPGIATYEEPASSPIRTPELATAYPLVMTNAKLAQFLHSQHRGVAALRRTHPDPTIEIHPDTAARHGVADGEWVYVETPLARVRARVDVTDSIAAGVVCAFHGWWEACEPLGRAALDPYSDEGANVNLVVDNETRDPISGAVPHRSTLCRLVRMDAA